MIVQITNLELREEYRNFKKILVLQEHDNFVKSKIRFEETLGQFDKNNSKKVSVNDLQCEIISIKKDIVDLKVEINNIKSDNNSLKQELLCLKIDEQFDQNIFLIIICNKMMILSLVKRKFLLIIIKFV